MNHLVIGYGEVGQGLYEVLSTEQSPYTVDAYDPYRDDVPGAVTDVTYDMLHICIPFHEKFVETVLIYIQKFGHPCTITVIHSTVPVGTTRKVLEIAKAWVWVVHSPIRGVHPNLALGIRTFPKCFGGSMAKTAAEAFERLGVKTRTYDNSDTTEAIKLWDTTQYGWQIVLAKEIDRWCQEHGLDFEEVYRETNRDYNDGYEKLGRPEVVRPWLKGTPGKIGGHCVIPNCVLLDDAVITKIILERNETY